MTVITLSACPQKLKGDITRWMFEIDTGVYVGNLSARVRDQLWERICDNIGSGRASMAYSTNNEQKFEVKIYGDVWEPVDFDGIKLVRRNFRDAADDDYKRSSKAAVNHTIRLSQQKQKTVSCGDYVVIDTETTGIQDDACIIELAALRIINGMEAEKYVSLVKCGCEIPKEISRLTGITDEMLTKEGAEPSKAAADFAEFCGSDTLVGHNIMFDIRMLQKMFRKHNIPWLKNKVVDTVRLARKKTDIAEGYGLASICRHFGIEVSKQHRALDDCELTYRIYEKLKEIE